MDKWQSETQRARRHGRGGMAAAGSCMQATAAAQRREPEHEARHDGRPLTGGVRQGPDPAEHARHKQPASPTCAFDGACGGAEEERVLALRAQGRDDAAAALHGLCPAQQVQAVSSLAASPVRLYHAGSNAAAPWRRLVCAGAAWVWQPGRAAVAMIRAPGARTHTRPQQTSVCVLVGAACHLDRPPLFCVWEERREKKKRKEGDRRERERERRGHARTFFFCFLRFWSLLRLLLAPAVDLFQFSFFLFLSLSLSLFFFFFFFLFVATGWRRPVAWRRSRRCRRTPSPSASSLPLSTRY